MHLMGYQMILLDTLKKIMHILNKDLNYCRSRNKRYPHLYATLNRYDALFKDIPLSMEIYYYCLVKINTQMYYDTIVDKIGLQYPRHYLRRAEILFIIYPRTSVRRLSLNKTRRSGHLVTLSNVLYTVLQNAGR